MRHQSDYKQNPDPGAGTQALGEAIYEVAILRSPSAAEPVAPRATIYYCDVCRRWGGGGLRHRCWRNWRVRLSDAIGDALRGGAR